MKIDLNRPLKPRDNPTVVIPLHELRALEALAADRLELAKVVDRHRKDRMHSDMKLAWEMAKEILAQAKEDRDE